MHSLQSNSLKSLYKYRSDEDKLELISSLVEDMSWETFLHSELVFSMLKKKVISILNTIYTKKNKEVNCLTYLILHSSIQKYNIIYQMTDKYYLEDMLTYVRPDNWKYYKIEDGKFIINPSSDGVPLNLEKNIIEKGINPDDIYLWKRKRDGKYLTWHDF